LLNRCQKSFQHADHFFSSRGAAATEPFPPRNPWRDAEAYVTNAKKKTPAMAAGLPEGLS